MDRLSAAMWQNPLPNFTCQEGEGYRALQQWSGSRKWRYHHRLPVAHPPAFPVLSPARTQPSSWQSVCGEEPWVWIRFTRIKYTTWQQDDEKGDDPSHFWPWMWTAKCRKASRSFKLYKLLPLNTINETMTWHDQWTFHLSGKWTGSYIVRAKSSHFSAISTMCSGTLHSEDHDSSKTMVLYINKLYSVSVR